MKPRIGIVGCAGTGKSSLAKALAAKLNIPFVESKGITQDILSRDGYDYGSGIQVEMFLANTGRQNEILRRTVEQQEVEEFVTDRTVVDLAAYALLEMHHREPQAVRDIVETCRRNLALYSHLFLCPWNDGRISENRKRTLNPWYQFLIHAIERGILEDWTAAYHVLTAEDTASRAGEVIEVVRDER